jgi:hypothetical protein
MPGLLASALVAALAAFAPGDVGLSGRYENQASLLAYRDGLALLDENRLRAALEVRPGEPVAFEAAAWARTMHGATTFDLAVLMPEAVADSLPDSLRAGLKVPLAGGFTLDRAFATVNWSRFRLRVGKQPLAWGVGYVWNPAEVIAAKSYIDPAYEREGVNAVRLEWLAPVTVQAIGLPGPDLAGSGAVGRIAGNTLGFDWALTGWRRPDPAAPADVFIGGQVKGELVLPGVWGEGGYHPARGDRPGRWELVAGADYTLPTRTHILAEYRHNSGGRAARGYPDTDWLDHVLGRRASLGADYLYAAARQPVAGFSSLALGALANLSDRSAVLMPAVLLGLADNVDLAVFGTWMLGGGDSEYGAPRAKGAVARLSLYF